MGLLRGRRFGRLPVRAGEPFVLRSLDRGKQIVDKLAEMHCLNIRFLGTFLRHSFISANTRAEKRLRVKPGGRREKGKTVLRSGENSRLPGPPTQSGCE